MHLNNYDLLETGKGSPPFPPLYMTPPYVFTGSLSYHFFLLRKSFYIECLRGQQLRETKNTTPLSPSRYTGTQVPAVGVQRQLQKSPVYTEKSYPSQNSPHQSSSALDNKPSSPLLSSPHSSKAKVTIHQQCFIHDNTNQVNRAHTDTIHKSITGSTLSEHIWFMRCRYPITSPWVGSSL